MAFHLLYYNFLPTGELHGGTTFVKCLTTDDLIYLIIIILSNLPF